MNRGRVSRELLLDLCEATGFFFNLASSSTWRLRALQIGDSLVLSLYSRIERGVCTPGFFFVSFESIHRHARVRGEEYSYSEDERFFLNPRAYTVRWISESSRGPLDFFVHSPASSLFAFALDASLPVLDHALFCSTTRVLSGRKVRCRYARLSTIRDVPFPRTRTHTHATQGFLAASPLSSSSSTSLGHFERRKIRATHAVSLVRRPCPGRRHSQLPVWLSTFAK